MAPLPATPRIDATAISQEIGHRTKRDAESERKMRESTQLSALLPFQSFTLYEGRVASGGSVAFMR